MEFHYLWSPGYTTDLHDGQILKSDNDKPIKVTKLPDGTIYFNDAKVLTPNVIVTNGVIHVLDKVRPLPAHFPSTSTRHLPGTREFFTNKGLTGSGWHRSCLH
jgi:hypothetical protein